MSAFHQASEASSLGRMRKKYQSTREKNNQQTNNICYRRALPNTNGGPSGKTRPASVVLRAMCWKPDLKGRATREKCYGSYEKTRHRRGVQKIQKAVDWRTDASTLSAKKERKRNNLGWMVVPGLKKVANLHCCVQGYRHEVGVENKKPADSLESTSRTGIPKCYVSYVVTPALQVMLCYCLLQAFLTC